MKTLKVGDIVLGEGKPKICIPLVSSTAEGLLKEAAAAAKKPCDLVEWRADYFLDAMGGLVLSEVCRRLKLLIKEIKNITGKPVIFTIRTEMEGGKIGLKNEGYFYINKVIAETGLADFIDIEAFDAPGVVPEDEIRDFVEFAHANNTYVLMSNHDIEGTPDQEELMTRMFVMQSLGADVMKLVVTPESQEDVLELLATAAIMKDHYAEIPFIVISMGELGTNTRVCGGEFGSVMTFAAGKKASAPGQIGAVQLKMLLDKYYGEEESK